MMTKKDNSKHLKKMKTKQFWQTNYFATYKLFK